MLTLLYPLVYGLFILVLFMMLSYQAKAQTYDIWTIYVGTPNDTTVMDRGTNNLYHYDTSTGVYNFIGTTNPIRYEPWNLVSGVAKIIADTLALSDSIGKKLDKVAFAGLFTAALTSGAMNTAYGFTPYNSSNPSGYISSVPAQSFSSLTGKPTTISGYGITDATTTARAAISAGTGISYNSTTGVITNAGTTYTAGTGIGIASGVISNTSPAQAITITATGDATGTSTSSTTAPSLPLILANTGVTAGTYETVTTDSKGRIISGYNSSPNIVTRTINSSTYTISTTRPATVCYNLTISCTATIGSASTGSVALMYSTNGGSTYTTVGTVSNSNTVTLAIVLNSVQISGLQLCGVIPANALVKLVPTTSGTTTITYLTGEENY